jgi:hypothetical protein
MFTISQIVDHYHKRVLECVWLHSDDKLTCLWVEQSSKPAAVERSREEEQDQSQRVA